MGVIAVEFPQVLASKLNVCSIIISPFDQHKILII